MFIGSLRIDRVSVASRCVRATLRIAVLAVVLTLAGASETPPPEPTAVSDPVVITGLPPIPNPFGFDARLALRTHLEEDFGQTDCAGLGWAELAQRYHDVIRPKAEPVPVVIDPAVEAAAAEQVRRDNLILQLERQFEDPVDPATPTAELQERVLAHLRREHHEGGGPVRRVAPTPERNTTPRPMSQPAGPSTSSPRTPVVRAPPAAAPPAPAVPTPTQAGLVDGGRSYTADSAQRVDTLVAAGAARGLTVLVIFETASCPWCERLRGYLTPALRKYKDRLAVIRVTVGSSSTTTFAKDSQVTKYPTVFRYENGRKTQSIAGCPVEESGFISWLGW